MTAGRARPRGLFLSFEGIDGAGKSTQIDAVEAALRAAGHAVRRTREPGGSPLAESLRTLFLGQPMDGLTEALLVFAARRDHVQRVIRPALDAGEAVLCDRFVDASFAYQGAGRGFDAARLAQLESWALDDGAGSLVLPELTLWFDVDPAIAAARRGARAADADRLEAEDEAFFARVRDGYAARADEAPHRIRRIDAAQSPQQVQAAVLAEVQRVLDARRGLGAGHG